MMKLNLRDVINQILLSFKRFTITFLFVIATTITLSYVLLTDKTINNAIYYYLSAGTLMSLLFHLWSEATEHRKAITIINVSANLLLLADTIWLYLNECNLAIGIAHAAVIVSFLIGIFTIPFLKRESDLSSFIFTNKSIVLAITSYMVCALAALSVMALYEGTTSLFGISVKSENEFRIMVMIWILFVQMVGSFILLSRIPSIIDVQKNSFTPSKFYTNSIRYLLIPIVTLYMAVLYVYMLTILKNWELPNGNVSMLVSIMMVGILLIIRQLYPIEIENNSNKYEHLAIKWLPRLALPVLVLMTIGILRRFSDYGPTPNRLYILTFNIWFYIICIGLILTKAKRINWIFISFAILFLLSSAQPFNFCEITRYTINNKIADVVKKCPPSNMPIETENDFGAWLHSLPDSSGINILSSMKTLSDCGYRSDLNYLISDELSFWYGIYFSNTLYRAETLEDVYRNWEADTLAYSVCSFVEIPQGYSKVRYYRASCHRVDSLVMHNDSIDTYINFIDSNDEQNDSLRIRTTLTEINEHKPLRVTTSGGEERLILIQKAEVKKYRYVIYVYVSGLMFVK